MSTMPFTNTFNSKDMLFNKKKISPEVLSMSSSSSSCSSLSSRSSRSSTTNTSSGSSFKGNSGNTDHEKYEKYKEDTESDDGSMEEYDDNDETNIKDSINSHRRNHDIDRNNVIKNEINEKMELLYQMERLESKGYRLPFKFNMESNIHEMRAEYNKLIKEKEIDASVRFQRKMLMAFVTGTEYINTRYDPMSLRLDGWSEQVHENIQDYDDIFEELHLKYKSTGKKMSPELRLFISLSGSAFMFHLTSRMFKENPLPEVENVLKSNPDLMRQFQAAAAKQYISGDDGRQPEQTTGLFGMVNSLFNNLSGGSSSSQRMFEDEMQQSRNKRSNQDIDNIISNVHSKISFDREQNNIETLSVSDEEITSIIEDTADIRILKNGKNKNARTLNL